jgi:APA family basic amino acid/polyamine antiporter
MSKTAEKDIKYYATTAALAVVVANMIGTGVFTSIGFQLQDITEGTAMLALWAIGGVTALCGALCYAELGASLPRSGGEYHFLSQIYHPLAGFLSGWVSATVGFAAPVALAAIALGSYLTKAFPFLSDFWIAIFVIVLVTAFHVTTRKRSAGMQWYFTLIKLVVIALFCGMALLMSERPESVQQLSESNWARFNFDQSVFDAMTSGAFAVALIYVNYAYNGWNAAAYITNELERPQKSLPRILVLGTGVVMLAYLALNFAFLYSTPMSALAGQVEAALVVAIHLLGNDAGRVAGIVMALLLISTISAMTLAGPRVLNVMGQDYRTLSWLGKLNNFGIPSRAIYFQSTLALLFVITSTFEQVLIFSGLLLTLNNFFTVFGLIVLRIREPDLNRPFKVPLYSLPALVFLSLNAWIMVYLLIEKTENALPGLFLLLIGGVLYWAIERRSNGSRADTTGLSS